jgi:hypothetical protein
MKQKPSISISSYLSRISSTIFPRIKSYPIYMTKPLHYSVLEYELHYLLDPDSITFTGEWYPLYLSSKVKVPEPISKTLNKFEKRHRLQLLYTALYHQKEETFPMTLIIIIPLLCYGLYLLFSSPFFSVSYSFSWSSLLFIYIMISSQSFSWTTLLLLSILF